MPACTAVKGVSVWESFHPICQTMHMDGGGLGGWMDNDAGGGGVRNGKGSFHPISQTMLIVPPDSPLRVGVKTLPAYYERVLGGGKFAVKQDFSPCSSFLANCY